ncbi:MAG: M48 family metallopeptidase [Steroidobacteraceae bacterium]
MATKLPARLILPPEAEWGRDFDPAQATQAYLETFPAAERASSDAYFEGGYWIALWSVVIAVAVLWLLLATRFSARLRDATERRTQRPFLQSWLYALGFWSVLSLLMLPWTLYTGYFLEHAYAMSNQSLPAFLVEWPIALGLALAIVPLGIAGIYALVRRVRERWVYWATGLTALFILFIILVNPVFVAPLFNDYHPLPEGEIRDSILALADEARIPTHDVWWYDASRQTRRISANVAGIAGTTRIALNDNLLNGTSLPEIRAVMAHEMGHYRLHHAWSLTFAFAMVLGFGYWAVNRAFGSLQRRFGERFGVRDIADPAGLPLAFATFSVVMLLLTPLTNTIVRTAEHQADTFGLEAAREPHGFASVSIRLGAYRKLDPSPLEEILFFDHPSGRARVARAMVRIADHPPTLQ